MLLDFDGRHYLLSVNRGEQLTPTILMREYGFDYSLPSSTFTRGVLYTPNPFLAASFLEYATPAAQNKLGWIDAAIRASRAESSGRHIACPPGEQLEPFQRADVDYIMRREHALDGDEPGLGKTPTSICVANEMQSRRNIVVCPAQVRLQWDKQIRRWSTIRDVRIYIMESAKYGVDLRADWIVVSYDLVALNPHLLRAITRGHFDLGVFDECHYLKENGIKRSRACIGYWDDREDDTNDEEHVTACIAERCSRILFLTGTLLPNRPREAYVAARTLCWESIDWMSQRRFNEHFNPRNKKASTSGKVYIEEGRGHEPELQNRLRTYFMTRHLDKDVRKQMHYPVYDLIHVQETDAVKLALKAESLLHIDPDTFQGEGSKFDGEVSTARRLMGEAMAPQVADYVNVLLDGGEKIALFAWHHSVIDMIAAKTKHHGIVTIDGRDTPAEKEAKKLAFIGNPKIRCLIGNILTAGVGMDGLQDVCSHGLIAEPDWVPGNNIQAFKRLDRMGQKEQVFGEIFVAPGSIAEHILGTALRKGQSIYNSLDRRVGDELMW